MRRVLRFVLGCLGVWLVLRGLTAPRERAVVRYARAHRGEPYEWGQPWRLGTWDELFGDDDA